MGNINITSQNKTVTLALKGDFINFEDNSLLQNITDVMPENIIIDGQQINKWDSSLLLILFNLNKYANQNRIGILYC